MRILSRSPLQGIAEKEAKFPICHGGYPSGTMVFIRIRRFGSPENAIFPSEP